MEMLIQTFQALDDQGDSHTLCVYQAQVPVATRANPSATMPGMKRLVTDDGQSVKRRAKGEYEIEQTGQILRSKDSGAP
jgi:hypothetical protein